MMIAIAQCIASSVGLRIISVSVRQNRTASSRPSGVLGGFVCWCGCTWEMHQIRPHQLHIFFSEDSQSLCAQQAEALIKHKQSYSHNASAKAGQAGEICRKQGLCPYLSAKNREKEGYLWQVGSRGCRGQLPAVLLR